MYCTDRTHLVCGHPFSNYCPLTCTLLALRQSPDEATSTDLTVYVRLVPRLTYGLYHISGWGFLSLLHCDAKTFSKEGPDRGVIASRPSLVTPSGRLRCS